MKVLMVCLGNICRSPMAEGILRDTAAAAGMAMEVDSAGTGNYHVGEPPDHRAIAYMSKKGHNIASLRARQFVTADFDRFDKIYVMDASNYSNVVKLATHETDRGKVKMILNEILPGRNKEVPDPYFGGEEGFAEVYQLLGEACGAIISKLP